MNREAIYNCNERFFPGNALEQQTNAKEVHVYGLPQEIQVRESETVPHKEESFSVW